MLFSNFYAFLLVSAACHCVMSSLFSVFLMDRNMLIWLRTSSIGFAMGTRDAARQLSALRFHCARRLVHFHDELRMHVICDCAATKDG